MKSIIWALVTALVFAVAQARAQAPQMPLLAVDALRGDLEVIWSAVEQGDPAFDRYRSRAQLRRVFDEVRARIDHPMTELEFYRIVAPAVAALGNGHAQVSLSAPTGEWLAQRAPLLPMGVRFLQGKLYIVRDFSGNSLAGAEIVSINGVSARRLLRNTVAAMSLDGVSETPRENAAGGWLFLYDLVRLQGFGPNYDIAYRLHGANNRIRIVGKAGTDIIREWRARHPTDPEVMERSPPSLAIAGGVAVLRIAHWDDDLPLHYEDWLTQMQPAHALVIDVRDNGGGNENTASELLTHLANRPFRYYTCLTINAADFDFFRYATNADELRREIPNYVRPASPTCRSKGALEMTEAAFSSLGVQPTRQPHFAGRVYLLVNSSSFSTSSEFASMFHALHIGTIIGQETSGGYLGDSSGLEANVRLPASGMSFNANLIAYHMAVPRRRGVQGGVLPDFVVSPSVDDLITGRDVEMARMRELERRAG